jgi:hypothetical protein
MDEQAAKAQRYLARADGQLAKPLILWEFGFKGLDDTDTDHKSIKTFDYGLASANSAMVAINRGLTGAALWCLHSMHYSEENRMAFGLWEYKDLGWKIRPVYYAHALFTNYARGGMKTLRTRVEPASASFQAATLEGAAGGRVLYLLNLSDKPVRAEISCLPGKKYMIHRYEAGRLPAPDSPLYESAEALRPDGETWSPADGDLTVAPRSLVLAR